VSLFQHAKIETTVAKAKETKKFAERIITLAKKGDLHSRSPTETQLQSFLMLLHQNYPAEIAVISVF
jgi:large subunit ribosomal protein L17